MASNGKLPSSDLAELSTPGRLTIDAAASFERLRTAAGVTGTESSVEAYRTYDQQADLFTDRYQTKYCEYAPGKVDARTWQGDTWYRKPGESAAAVPGTSNHGWGITVDWQNLGGYGSSSWERFADIAPSHGWSNQEGREVDEPWHWSYSAGADKHYGEDQEVELSDKVELSDGMRELSGFTAQSITVEQALGYLTTGVWGTGRETDGLATKVDQLLENQQVLLDALADLNVHVDLNLHSRRHRRRRC